MSLNKDRHFRFYRRRQHFPRTFAQYCLQWIIMGWFIQLKNIIIRHCGVLLILIVDLGRSLSTDYTALSSFHTPEIIIALE